MKLTKNREKVLRAAAAGGSVCPGGYHAAWRDARHWWSAFEWLRGQGLVERRDGTHACYATPKGRELVATLDAAAKG